MSGLLQRIQQRERHAIGTYIRNVAWFQTRCQLAPPYRLSTWRMVVPPAPPLLLPGFAHAVRSPNIEGLDLRSRQRPAVNLHFVDAAGEMSWLS